MPESGSRDCDDVCQSRWGVARLRRRVPESGGDRQLCCESTWAPVGRCSSPFDSRGELLCRESREACCPKLLGQWAALEELYKAQQTRAIAVSNFGAAELACLSGHTVLLADS